MNYAIATADALRKFGPKIEDAALFFQKARERFYFLNDFEHNDRQIRDDIAQLEEKADRDCRPA